MKLNIRLMEIYVLMPSYKHIITTHELKHTVFPVLAQYAHIY